ncbi:Dyp-type peroxidase [Sciscionella sediminilitoris]|uniref:Dyp-type peroxidase n=1 Tax=Sciscionella sediminilitoris TaxID=1445613 RepID=UPI0004DF4771|nr:Dyp-type peroxidase [Sciscionella sp. SE31]
MSEGLGRRSFLRGALLGAGAAGATGAVTASTADGAAAPEHFPFHGPHQPGVLRPNAAQALVVSFDVVTEDLRGLLRTITERARFLCTGGSPAPVGIEDAPSDSGVLGPEVPADGLTVTLAVGSSLFDGRFGLAARKPPGLVPMRTFPNDSLDPEQCHGDLCLTFAAAHRDTVLHALRDIAKHTRGAMQARWKMDGFTSPSRPHGTPRNLLGFRDGTSNPDAGDRSEMDGLVWTPDGGTFQVVRLIRMLVEFWDRIDISEQENIFGRRRDSGAPLDGQHEFDVPRFAEDPVGTAIPITAHIRLANPRRADTEPQRILRRAYNYDRGIDKAGNLDMGLLFTCYQRDIRNQFEAVQTRLIDEPLVDYIQPFGGGYFFVLPGITDQRDYLGSALFEDR